MSRIVASCVLAGGAWLSSQAWAVLASAAPAKRPAEIDWNDAAMQWKPLAEGLEEAAAKKKPVCLVVFTTWCPHCKRYSRVFHDPRVAFEAKGFVMIKLDQDESEAESARYNVDGTYIPRTFLLASNGDIDREIHAPRPTYRHFFDEDDAGDLLAAMKKARKKLR
jgi:thiol:disulfide interchange protein